MRNESKYRMRSLKPQIDTLRWTTEETKIAVNLYEHGAKNEDIAQTLNQLFQTGRTGTGVRAKMHMLGIKWGCAAAVLDPSMVRKHNIASRGGRSRAALFDDDDRVRPWHPARDPKPVWLRNFNKGQQT